VGTVASDNPWEFFHKARFGSAASDPAMPATSDLGWSVQDAVDVMAYAQTLPTGEEAPAALPTTGAAQPAWAYPALLAGLLALILGLGLLVTQSLRRVQL